MERHGKKHKSQKISYRHSTPADPVLMENILRCTSKVTGKKE